MSRRPLLAAGTLMGIGMGGFIDGIFFHQIFQFHSMMSGYLPQDTIVNIKTSMVWDGIFHLLTWTATAISIMLLWRALKNPNVIKSGMAFWGSLFLGWGIFNFIEGIIDHHLLGVHHVIESIGISIYDYIFLCSGIIFTAIGWFMITFDKRNIISIAESNY